MQALPCFPHFPIRKQAEMVAVSCRDGIAWSCFFRTAFSESKLIKLASGFEAVTQVRRHNLPTFAQTVPFNNIQGTRLNPPHVHGSTFKPPVMRKRMPRHM